MGGPDGTFMHKHTNAHHHRQHHTCRSSGERTRCARGVVMAAILASRLRSSSTATRMSSASSPAAAQEGQGWQAKWATKPSFSPT